MKILSLAAETYSLQAKRKEWYIISSVMLLFCRVVHAGIRVYVNQEPKVVGINLDFLLVVTYEQSISRHDLSNAMLALAKGVGVDD